MMHSDLRSRLFFSNEVPKRNILVDVNEPVILIGIATQVKSVLTI